MKRCPRCGETYTDDTLKYCLQDGDILANSNPIRFDPNANTTPEADTLRLSESQFSNEKPVLNRVAQNEASALASVSSQYKSEAPQIDATLRNYYEINAAELGRKLWEVWKFKSRYSKFEFAQLLQIPADKIDAYFEGQEIFDLNRIIIATKLFNLPRDYFFRPTFNMRFAFWQEDIVKYAILSLVKPKANIDKIDNDGSFYARIINGLADKICYLHAFLFPSRQNETRRFNAKQTNLGQKLDKASDELKSNLADKYYKLLEQYPNPRQEEDRSLTPDEHILKRWFSVTGEYIARLIIEGIGQINIETPSSPIIKYRFEEDLERGEVNVQRYDGLNLKMTD